MYAIKRRSTITIITPSQAYLYIYMLYIYVLYGVTGSLFKNKHTGRHYTFLARFVEIVIYISQ